ncbi:hypothetical protein [uncultured Jatrophihabitans sp.]|uniref:hypothetical protein n=1 Tax=uncultured Jatrophihabitans sp. TaxID=1610747 RepID=UPI0035CA67EC
MAFQQRPDPSRTLAPVLGALAIAAVALIAIFTIGVKNDGSNPDVAGGTSVAADKALACPRAYAQTRGDANGWVPLRPRGLNGDDALVPDQTPTHAVVCAYLAGAEPSVTKSVALTGRSVLAGSLTGLVRTLSVAPRISGAKPACAALLTQADTRNYLFGLSYGKATLWVSAPGYHCAGSTNGSFTTRENLANHAAASYAAQKWVAAN